MILTEDNRALAKAFFEDFDVGVSVRKRLMNLTVRLTQGGNKASGVIIAVDQSTVYILTAKHVLYTLTGKSQPKNNDGPMTPEDFDDENVFGRFVIGYAPTDLFTQTTKTAAVTGIEWTGTDKQTWAYDIVTLQSTDEDFLKWVGKQPFVYEEVQEEYQGLLYVKNEGADILNTGNYEFFQLGYGDGKVEAYQETRGNNYKNFGGCLQCKISTPSARKPVNGVYEPDADLTPDKWPKSDQVCLMNANVANSSGPGDSGGPLFCRSKSKKNQFYLVGVTSGANFSTNQVQGYNHSKIHNNGVAYWNNLFLKWKWDPEPA